jgi:molecular chaperone GrpE
MALTLEGLDPTSEAELDTADVEPAPDQASLARALRELEAAKSRVERDAERSAHELREKLVNELLPVLDNLDRSIAAAGAAAATSREARSILDGVHLVRSQFAAVLGRYGLERLETRNTAFDPNIHDAIGTVPVSDPSFHNVVVDQVEPGYRFESRLVRPAKVIVGRLAPRLH